MLQEIAKILLCDCTSRREQFMYLSNHKNTKTLHTFNISPQQSLIINTSDSQTTVIPNIHN